MTRSRLFRAAALEAQRAAPVGEVLLVPPLSHATLAAVALAAGCAVAAFGYWGTYTAHSTLPGQLVTDPAVVRVYAPQPGIVVAQHVHEGQAVAAGDLLYVVSSERVSSGLGASREVVAAELDKRLRSLEAEREASRMLERTERQSLERAAAALRAEVADVAAMHATQIARVALAEEQAARYAEVQARGFVTHEQLLARHHEAAEQRLRAQSYERERRQAERQLSEIVAELESAPIRHQQRRAELERASAAVRQERVENEVLRSVLIVAPADGIATGLGAYLGQATDGARPLVSIVPAGAVLRAELYAPSRAIGFVQPGDLVLLRYRAYPYQKFGHHRGTVRSISRWAFGAADLAGSALTAASDGEPLYRIAVELPAQSIQAYGKSQSLQPGMLIDADVLHDTRRLYEWVLEPLYSLRR